MLRWGIAGRAFAEHGSALPRLLPPFRVAKGGEEGLLARHWRAA